MVRGVRDAEAAQGDGRKDGPSRGAGGELHPRSAQPDRGARPAGRNGVGGGHGDREAAGFGIAPKHLELVLGRTLRADVEADDVLTWRWSDMSTPQVIVDPTYGYRRLEPCQRRGVPALLREPVLRPDPQGRRRRTPPAAGRRRGGRARAAWLRETLYADITAGLEEHGSGRRVLDVGCGTGRAAAVARRARLRAARDRARRRRGGAGPRARPGREDGDPGGAARGARGHRRLRRRAAAERARARARRRRDAARDPAPARAGGLLYIRVPNDFNPLQLSAQAKLGAALVDRLSRPRELLRRGLPLRAEPGGGSGAGRRPGRFPDGAVLLMGSTTSAIPTWARPATPTASRPSAR